MYHAGLAMRHLQVRVIMGLSAWRLLVGRTFCVRNRAGWVAMLR
jgi:hypothetical protein